VALNPRGKNHRRVGSVKQSDLRMSIEATFVAPNTDLIQVPWRASLTCATWLVVHVYDIARAVYVTYLIDILDLSHWYMWHDSLECATWLPDICDTTPWNVRHDSQIYVTRLSRRHSYVIGFCHSYMRFDRMHSFMRHDSRIYVTWLTGMCDMTRSCVWHGRRHMTYIYLWHDSFTRVTWRIRMRDVTPWYVRHDSFRCVMRIAHMCDISHSFM